jgi:hypothetical protein
VRDDVGEVKPDMTEMRITLATICSVTLAIFAPSAKGATVSISQPTFTGIADFSPSGFGQSFTANGDYSIVAIDLYISSSAGGSDATLRLYDFNSSLPALGASVLGTGTFFESDLNATPQWVRVELLSPVTVTNGNAYAFTIIAMDPGGSATGWNNYGVNSSDVYAGGGRITVTPVSVKTTDLAFQVVTVPEPGAVSLAALGILLGINRRTRPPA